MPTVQVHFSPSRRRVNADRCESPVPLQDLRHPGNSKLSIQLSYRCIRHPPTPLKECISITSYERSGRRDPHYEYPVKTPQTLYIDASVFFAPRAQPTEITLELLEDLPV